MLCFGVFFFSDRILGVLYSVLGSQITPESISRKSRGEIARSGNLSRSSRSEVTSLSRFRQKQVRQQTFSLNRQDRDLRAIPCEGRIDPLLQQDNSLAGHRPLVEFGSPFQFPMQFLWNVFKDQCRHCPPPLMNASIVLPFPFRCQGGNRAIIRRPFIEGYSKRPNMMRSLRLSEVSPCVTVRYTQPSYSWKAGY